MHQLKGRGMNCVAAKVAEKILVFFQHDNAHTGARQQITEHHSRRAGAGDAAGRSFEFLHDSPFGVHGRLLASGELLVRTTIHLWMLSTSYSGRRKSRMAIFAPDRYSECAWRCWDARGLALTILAEKTASDL